jgi:hypothetical protein
MAALHDKIENALNEARILVLGGQVLIGSAYRSVFEPGFEKLSHSVQNVRLIALVLMLGGLGLLLVPPAFHRIVEQGEDTGRFHRLVTHVLEIALLPFAIGLGVDVYTTMGFVRPGWIDLLFGLVMIALAILLWYIFAIFRRQPVPKDDKAQPTSLTEKIKEALIEARMILPGAQALLGFQVASTLTDSFEKLPRMPKWFHFASLLAIALSTILLIAPAAYHRIALQGEDDQEFYRLSGRFLIMAMIFLSAGISAELFVVVQRINNSYIFSATLSTVIFILFNAMWFGYSFLKKKSS